MNNVRMFWLGFIALGLFYRVSGSPLPLVPYPQHVSSSSGLPAVINPRTFRFTASRSNIILEEAFARYHRYLNLHDFVQALPVTLETLDVVIDSLSEDLSLETNENYTLIVTKNMATLKANNVYGAMKGLETFSQLVSTRNYTVSCAEITDYPRYKFRGFMLDTSRHYLAVEAIKKLITAASWSKLNVFHWHIVDDPSFPYSSITFPEMVVAGAYSKDHVYSQSDILDILIHAQRHGVIVIPEFDTPGHTLSWGHTFPGFLTHCPKHGNIGSDYGAIDPTNENVYVILKKFFSEIVEVFPSDFIHLGGDEVRYGCWENNENITAWMKEHNITGDYEKLEDYYEKRLISIVDSLNKNYIVWEEIFNHHLDIKPKTIIHAWLPNWKSVFQNATEKGYRYVQLKVTIFMNITEISKITFTSLH